MDNHIGLASIAGWRDFFFFFKSLLKSASSLNILPQKEPSDKVYTKLYSVCWRGDMGWFSAMTHLVTSLNEHCSWFHAKPWIII